MQDQKYIIEAEGLEYTYDGNDSKTLKNVNLKIRKGKKVAFMGGNGSGKSTFFLCLNGIIKPDKGRILIDGNEIQYTRKGLLDVRKKVGIVFQNPDEQLFSASVYEEISFGILNLGVDEETARKAVEEVIEELEITEFQDRPAHALSGGQKKQVAIADILVMKPEIMILDEPAAALDPKHTKKVKEIVNRLTEKGITVLMATHDIDYVYGWADEVVLMHEGQILMYGTPEQICREKELLEMTNLELPAVLRLDNTKAAERRVRLETGERKKAILVVSFGTSHLDTLEKTIQVFEYEVREEFPECKVYRAFTSGMILRKLERTEQLKIDTVEEALKRIASDGYEEVIVQPTHIINGIENDRMMEVLMEHMGLFRKISVGKPLLTSVEDYKKSIHAVMAETPLAEDEVLVLMGHGTDHHANSAYPTLEYTFHALGYNQVLVGTVESFPELKNVIEKLEISGRRKVVLMPFMLVAGDHAKNDMAGDEDSWKSELESLGYEVRVILKGLGEFEGIRKILIEHIENVEE